MITYAKNVVSEYDILWASMKKTDENNRKGNEVWECGDALLKRIKDMEGISVSKMDRGAIERLMSFSADIAVALSIAGNAITNAQNRCVTLEETTHILTEKVAILEAKLAAKEGKSYTCPKCEVNPAAPGDYLCEDCR